MTKGLGLDDRVSYSGGDDDDGNVDDESGKREHPQPLERGLEADGEVAEDEHNNTEEGHEDGHDGTPGVRWVDLSILQRVFYARGSITRFPKIGPPTPPVDSIHIYYYSILYYTLINV